MSYTSMTKMKLLALWEILRQDTDQEHPITTNEICDRLAARDIPCERKSVAVDIALLNKCGYEVMQTKVGKQNGYYVEDRSFSMAELKILIDAVQAASFVTKKKAAVLTDKLAYLASSRRAEVLKNNLVHFNTRKHTNERIYYTVDRLEAAILRQCKAGFIYFDLNENHERIYRKEKREYVVDPITLIYMEDNYYLLCYSEKYQGVTSYRLDRMEHVRVLDLPVSPGAKMTDAQIAAFTDQTFKMYGGETEKVTLRFANHLIGTVYDKFGESTKMNRVDADSCSAEVEVQISPTFWGWLFQFAGEMQIVEPENLIDTYTALLQDALPADRITLPD